MQEKAKQILLNNLNKRLTIMVEQISLEESSETPNTEKINYMTKRKNKIQSDIDNLSK